LSFSQPNIIFTFQKSLKHVSSIPIVLLEKKENKNNIINSETLFEKKINDFFFNHKVVKIYIKNIYAL
jgi:hypothetical protein